MKIPRNTEADHAGSVGANLIIARFNTIRLTELTSFRTIAEIALPSFECIAKCDGGTASQAS